MIVKFQLNYIIQRLNSMFEADPNAMATLVEHRVPCSEALANHETAQVRSLEDGCYEVGMLGILNGMLGIGEDGYGPISAIYQKECRYCDEPVDDATNIGEPHVCGHVVEEPIRLVGFETSQSWKD